MILILPILLHIIVAVQFEVTTKLIPDDTSL